MPPSSRYPVGVQPSPTPSASSSAAARVTTTRTRRASVSKPVSGNVGTGKTAGEGVEIEDFRPPEWRTVLNRRADLGYPDFYPSRPGYNQPEDVLTEENVKNGFTARTFVAVGAESFSMHGPIHNHLLGGCLEMLIKLGQEVMEKRDEAMPALGERAFRIPVRVTYNDTKRQQFLSDLCNPSVPLHRLMRNPVPHGFKGLELFDTMFSPKSGLGHNRTPSGNAQSVPEPIPIDRAVWFIRVLGANEITAHRSRAQPTAAPVSAPSPVAATPSSTNTVSANPVLPLSSNDWYTQEFTVMYTSWLRIQLGQLSLPVTKGTLRAGIPPSKVVPGVLGDDKGRARWLAKWDYSTRLLRKLHTRRLVSSRLLCGWLADTLNTANLAQVGFIAHLTGEYLPDMSRHVSISRSCVRSACDRMSEIVLSPAADAMKNIEEMLASMVLGLFRTVPEALLSPVTWRAHGRLLETIVCFSIDRGTETPPTTVNRPDEISRELTELHDIKHRSEALCFKPAKGESTSSPRRHQMAEIYKLDAMDAKTSMAELCKSFFDGSSSPTSSSIDKARLEEKVFILLNWAMGLFTLGNHRAYAVYTLLNLWAEQYNEHRPVQFDFFPILYAWLDTSAAAKQGDNAIAIGIVYGELTRQGLFSYGRYIQNLIAHGHTARNRKSDNNRSHHLALLNAMPMFVEARDLLKQRRLALCGDNLEQCMRDEEEDEQVLEQSKEEAREYLPEVFGWSTCHRVETSLHEERYGRSASIRDAVDYQIPSMKGATRHRLLLQRFWLYPQAKAALTKQGRRPAMAASTFARTLHLFKAARGYATIADFMIEGLRVSDDEEILLIIIDTVRREADVWTAMDRWPSIVEALIERKAALDERGHHHKGLVSLLLELADNGHLQEDDEEDFRSNAEALKIKPMRTASSRADFRDTMPSLQKALTSGDAQTLSAISARLFTRHGPFPGWSPSWWATVISAIQAVDSNNSKKTSFDSAITEHVIDISKRSEDSLDDVVSVWLDRMSPSAIQDMLGMPSASAICVLLLNLAARRILQVVPLLDKLLYPAWKAAAATAITSKGRLPVQCIRAVEATVKLAQQLLLTAPPNEQLPPVDLLQALILQTARAKVFDNLNVQTLIRNLPFLVILQTSKGMSELLSKRISTLLQSLAMLPNFKAAVFRHLDLLKSVFLSNEWSKPPLDPLIEAGMVDTLKLIMSDGSSTSSNSLTNIASLGSSRFTAWRWTSIVLEMRVEFKRLAMRIENGEDVASARLALNHLIHATLDREASADDTDLLCEVFRGLDIVVAHEVLAVGLQRLTTLLGKALAAEYQDQLELSIKSVDLVLRILDSTPCDVSTPADTAFLGARHSLLDLLAVSLQAVERNMSTEEDPHLPDGLAAPDAGALLSIVIKLLQFTLGLPVTEPISLAVPKPDFVRLATSYLRMLLSCSRITVSEDSSMLCDMLGHIIDAAPRSSRSAIHAALLAEAATSTLSPDILRVWRERKYLPYSSPTLRSMALSAPSAIDDGHTDTVIPLDDRPWELFDHMIPFPPMTPRNEQFLASRPFRDTASIPMALFNPKLKREVIPGDDTSLTDLAEGETEPDDAWGDYASERNLGNGLAGEPTAAKQIATMLYAGPDQAIVKSEIPVNTSASPLPELDAAMSTVTNVSAISQATRPRTRRMSTRLAQASGSILAQASGANHDPITVDDEEEGEISDDVEAVDGPAAKRPRTNSSRPTTGGKVPRKTVGGKGVAWKGVGGKSLRKTTGGKVPRMGRRKSIVE